MHRPRRLEPWAARLVLGCAVAWVGLAHAADDAALRVVEPAQGITVTLRPTAARFDDANTAWIETGAGVVIVDAPSRGTCWTSCRTSVTATPRRWLAALDRRFFDGTVGEAIEAAWREVEGG